MKRAFQRQLTRLMMQVKSGGDPWQACPCILTDVLWVATKSAGPTLTFEKMSYVFSFLEPRCLLALIGTARKHRV
jgi:hypothetical protein